MKIRLSQLRSLIRESLLLREGGEPLPEGLESAVDQIEQWSLEWMANTNRPDSQEFKLNLNLYHLVNVSNETLRGIVPFYYYNCLGETTLNDTDAETKFNLKTRNYPVKFLNKILDQVFELKVVIGHRPSSKVADISGYVISNILTLGLDPFQTAKNPKTLDPRPESSARHELTHVAQTINTVIIEYAKKLKTIDPFNIDPVIGLSGITTGYGLGKHQISPETKRQLKIDVLKAERELKKDKTSESEEEHKKAKNILYLLNDYEYSTWKSSLLDDIMEYLHKNKRIGKHNRHQFKGIINNIIAGIGDVGVNMLAVDVAREFRNNAQVAVKKYSPHSKITANYVEAMMKHRPEFINDLIIGLEKRLKTWIGIE